MMMSSSSSITAEEEPIQSTPLTNAETTEAPSSCCGHQPQQDTCSIASTSSQAFVAGPGAKTSSSNNSSNSKTPKKSHKLQKLHETTEMATSPISSDEWSKKSTSRKMVSKSTRRNFGHHQHHHHRHPHGHHQKTKRLSSKDSHHGGSHIDNGNDQYNAASSAGETKEKPVDVCQKQDEMLEKNIRAKNFSTAARAINLIAAPNQKKGRKYIVVAPGRVVQERASVSYRPSFSERNFSEFLKILADTLCHSSTPDMWLPICASIASRNSSLASSIRSARDSLSVSALKYARSSPSFSSSKASRNSSVRSPNTARNSPSVSSSKAARNSPVSFYIVARNSPSVTSSKVARNSPSVSSHKLTKNSPSVSSSIKASRNSPTSSFKADRNPSECSSKATQNSTSANCTKAARNSPSNISSKSSQNSLPSVSSSKASHEVASINNAAELKCTDSTCSASKDAKSPVAESSSNISCASESEQASQEVAAMANIDTARPYEHCRPVSGGSGDDLPDFTKNVQVGQDERMDPDQLESFEMDVSPRKDITGVECSRIAAKTLTTSNNDVQTCPGIKTVTTVVEGFDSDASEDNESSPCRFATSTIALNAATELQNYIPSGLPHSSKTGDRKNKLLSPGISRCCVLAGDNDLKGDNSSSAAESPIPTISYPSDIEDTSKRSCFSDKDCNEHTEGIKAESYSGSTVNSQARGPFWSGHRPVICCAELRQHSSTTRLDTRGSEPCRTVRTPSASKVHGEGCNIPSSDSIYSESTCSSNASEDFWCFSQDRGITPQKRLGCKFFHNITGSQSGRRESKTVPSNVETLSLRHYDLSCSRHHTAESKTWKNCSPLSTGATGMHSPDRGDCGKSPHTESCEHTILGFSVTPKETHGKLIQVKQQQMTSRTPGQQRTKGVLKNCDVGFKNLNSLVKQKVVREASGKNVSVANAKQASSNGSTELAVVIAENVATYVKNTLTELLSTQSCERGGKFLNCSALQNRRCEHQLPINQPKTRIPKLRQRLSKFCQRRSPISVPQSCRNPNQSRVDTPMRGCFSERLYSSQSGPFSEIRNEHPANARFTIPTCEGERTGKHAPRCIPLPLKTHSSQKAYEIKSTSSTQTPRSKDLQVALNAEQLADQSKVCKVCQKPAQNSKPSIKPGTRDVESGCVPHCCERCVKDTTKIKSVKSLAKPGVLSKGVVQKNASAVATETLIHKLQDINCHSKKECSSKQQLALQLSPKFMAKVLSNSALPESTVPMVDVNVTDMLFEIDEAKPKKQNHKVNNTKTFQVRMDEGKNVQMLMMLREAPTIKPCRPNLRSRLPMARVRRKNYLLEKSQNQTEVPTEVKAALREKRFCKSDAKFVDGQADKKSHCPGYEKPTRISSLRKNLVAEHIAGTRKAGRTSPRYPMMANCRKRESSAKLWVPCTKEILVKIKKQPRSWPLPATRISKRQPTTLSSDGDRKAVIKPTAISLSDNAVASKRCVAKCKSFIRTVKQHHFTLPHFKQNITSGSISCNADISPCAKPSLCVQRSKHATSNPPGQLIQCTTASPHNNGNTHVKGLKCIRTSPPCIHTSPSTTDAKPIPRSNTNSISNIATHGSSITTACYDLSSDSERGCYSSVDNADNTLRKSVDKNLLMGKTVGGVNSGSRRLAFTLKEFVQLNASYNRAVDSVSLDKPITESSCVTAKTCDGGTESKNCVLDQAKKLLSWVTGTVVKVSSSCSNTHMMHTLVTTEVRNC